MGLIFFFVTLKVVQSQLLSFLYAIGGPKDFWKKKVFFFFFIPDTTTFLSI